MCFVHSFSRISIFHMLFSRFSIEVCRCFPILFNAFRPYGVVLRALFFNWMIARLISSSEGVPVRTGTMFNEFSENSFQIGSPSFVSVMRLLFPIFKI